MTPAAAKLRVGVIGAGGIAGKVHLPALGELDDAEVVAVCDLIERRAARAAEEHGIPATYVLYPEMLQKEELDAVFVLTEPDRLFRPALDCLRAGKHVFMEKPPGVTSFQAETLLREARSADRICQVGLNRRYIPLVVRVLELMRQQTTITQVEGRFYKHVSAAFCDGCVSAFESDTIHAADLVRWIAGGAPAAAATVEARHRDVVTNAWCSVVRFDNGVLGTVRANYMTGGRTHTLELHGPGASALVDLGIGGASCAARILLHEGAESYSLAAAGPGGQRWIELDGRQVAGGEAFHVYYGYLQEDREFLECIRQGRRPLADIAEAVESMRFMELLRAARI